jgi:hypothetical protein
VLKLPATVALLALVLQPANYRTVVENFHKQRTLEIGGDTGWAALTDLRWVEIASGS